MRWTAPLLVLLFASGGAAQTTVPDTLAPERYAPLGVGDRWEYKRNGGPDPGPTHLRRTIVGDTTIDGERWAVRREQGFRSGGRTAWTRTEDVRRYYRFDADLANVVEWEDGVVSPVYRCRLDLPVPVPQDEDDREVRLCSDPEVRLSSFTGDPSYSKTVRVDEDGAVEASIVFSESFFSGPVLELDVGEVEGTSGEGFFKFVLAYADVGDETRGEPVENMPYLPDLTPPASYYPLGVGDQWVYSENNVVFHGYRRRTVVRDSVVGNHTYAVVESAFYDLRSEVPIWDVTGTDLLRFDPETTDVVELLPDGREFPVITNLGADFLECPTPPFGPDCEYYYDVYPGTPVTIQIGEEEVSVSSVKLPVGGLANVWPPGFAAGIGRLESDGHYLNRFEYARVGGAEYGARPVATTDRPAPPAFGLSVGPNPTSGPVALALDLPAPADVTAEAFDALGRRVWTRTAPLGAGRQALALDAGPWAPGLYVVRVTARGAARTVRVVRR